MNPAAAQHQEIERRFLVGNPPDGLEKYERLLVEQGYIAMDPHVRLRRVDDRQFFLTVKRGPLAGHEEREIELSAEQFAELWPLTEGRRVRKIRHRIPYEGHLIELDFFLDRHEGLRIAEVEFADVEAMRAFRKVDWFGREITGEQKYSNASLAACLDENPFRDSWTPRDKAGEAEVDDPGEFEERRITEDAEGPVPGSSGRTHGERPDSHPRKEGL